MPQDDRGPSASAARLEVVGIPVGADNYVWLVHHRDGAVGVVDPTSAAPVLAWLEARRLRPDWVFCTHHHSDHVGGNAAIVQAFPGCRVLAGRYDVERGRIPIADAGLDDGDVVTLGDAEAVVRAVPGHTLGHVALHFAEDRIAFVGDTLFAAGCGRLFEGSAAQLDHALHDVIARWSPATRLYCAHEYTASNLRFARHLLPDDPAVGAASAEVERLRGLGAPTVPTTLAHELLTNPFLRLYDPRIRAAVDADDRTPRAEVFARLRAAKDGFR